MQTLLHEQAKKVRAEQVKMNKQRECGFTHSKDSKWHLSREGSALHRAGTSNMLELRLKRRLIVSPVPG